MVRVLAKKFYVSKTQIANVESNEEEIYKIWAENDKRKLTKLKKYIG